jgi:hypothetical protein
VNAFRSLLVGTVVLGLAACGDSTPAGEAAAGERETGDYRNISGAGDRDTLARTRIIGDLDTIPAREGVGTAVPGTGPGTGAAPGAGTGPGTGTGAGGTSTGGG